MAVEPLTKHSSFMSKIAFKHVFWDNELHLAELLEWIKNYNNTIEKELPPMHCDMSSSFILSVEDRPLSDDLASGRFGGFFGLISQSYFSFLGIK